MDVTFFTKDTIDTEIIHIIIIICIQSILLHLFFFIWSRKGTTG